MKRILPLCLLTLSLVWTLCPAALAIEPMGAAVTAQVCYPTSISRSEDGTQLKKIYDLGPEEDPAGIPRSDFEQDGFHYRYNLHPALQGSGWENGHPDNGGAVCLWAQSEKAGGCVCLSL